MPCVENKIIVILHKCKFISLVLLIMDVNLTLISCNVAILIAIVLLYSRNVFIDAMNGNFRAYNVCSCVDSGQSIKTIGIAQITIQLVGINCKTMELGEIQAISLPVNIVYVIVLGITFCVNVFVVRIFRTLCA